MATLLLCIHQSKEEKEKEETCNGAPLQWFIDRKRERIRE